MRRELIFWIFILIVGPLLNFAVSAGEVIPNHYIVVLHNDLPQETIEAHHSWVNGLQSTGILSRVFRDSALIGIKYKWDGELNAYAGHFSEGIIATILAAPEVKYVEPDRIVTISEFSHYSAPSVWETQYDAPSWGLARVSRSSKQPHTTNYIYESSAGEGVTIYTLDTGVYTGHSDFEGRASEGTNTLDKSKSAADDFGHGTFVAGVLIGKTHGMAKKGKVVAVKVLNGTGHGSTSTTIDGIQWIRAKVKGKERTAIINMSFNSASDWLLDAYVGFATDSGITCVVSAGNDYDIASNYSPGDQASVITVGATDMFDNAAKYSNDGPDVDIFAPGSNVTSAWIGGPKAKHTGSGTSYAAPLVAGFAAILISAERVEGYTAITDRILQLAENDVVKNTRDAGTTRRFLYNHAPYKLVE